MPVLSILTPVSFQNESIERNVVESFVFKYLLTNRTTHPISKKIVMEMGQYLGYN